MKKILILFLILILSSCSRPYTLDKGKRQVVYLKEGVYEGTLKLYDMVHIVKDGVKLENFNIETLLTIKGVSGGDVNLENINSQGEILIDMTVNSYVDLKNINTYSMSILNNNDVYLNKVKIEKLTINNKGNVTIVDSEIKELIVKNSSEIKITNTKVETISNPNNITIISNK